MVSYFRCIKWESVNFSPFNLAFPLFATVASSPICDTSSSRNEKSTATIGNCIKTMAAPQQQQQQQQTTSPSGGVRAVRISPRIREKRQFKITGKRFTGNLYAFHIYFICVWGSMEAGRRFFSTQIEYSFYPTFGWTKKQYTWLNQRDFFSFFSHNNRLNYMHKTFSQYTGYNLNQASENLERERKKRSKTSAFFPWSLLPGHCLEGCCCTLSSVHRRQSLGN